VTPKGNNKLDIWTFKPVNAKKETPAFRDFDFSTFLGTAFYY